MNREELSKLIEKHVLESYRELLLGTAEECIRLTSTRDKAKPCPVGSSKLGGDPDLPANVEWPTSDDCDLYVIAQIKLSELPPLAAELGLPRSGMLYFFYDMENQPWGFDPKDKCGHRVLYFDDEENLSRRTPPEAIEFEDGLLECSLSATSHISLPSEPPEEISYEENEADYDSYFDLLGELVSDHQMLGKPAQVQNPMELECQLASNGIYVGDSKGYNDPRAKELSSGAKDWRLLFQMGSDDGAGVIWGDVGTIYFWIREQDLAEKRFDKTWLILQCC